MGVGGNVGVEGGMWGWRGKRVWRVHGTPDISMLTAKKQEKAAES